MKVWLTQWNFFRIVRLLMGIAVLIQGLQMGDKLMGILGLLFASMALLNRSCCVGGTCSMNLKSPINKKTNYNDIVYEEVVEH